MNQDFRPSVLVYHVYVVNNWKKITDQLLSNVPHDDIYVSLSLDTGSIYQRWKALRYFQKNPKVKKVFISENKQTLSEVNSLNIFREQVPLEQYKLLTYMHAKGVTKPKNKNIRDWVELMRYFLMDRYDLSVKAFQEGYSLYGVSLAVYHGKNERYGPDHLSDFHYSGNFLTVNLEQLAGKIKDTPVDNDYFGVEGYWGKLCTVDKAFCAHMSSDHISNHYKEPYPEHLYKKK